MMSSKYCQQVNGGTSIIYQINPLIVGSYTGISLGLNNQEPQVVSI